MVHERQMMFAVGKDRNIFDYYRSFFGRSEGFPELSGNFFIGNGGIGHLFFHHFCKPARRFQKSFPIRVLTDGFQYQAGCLFKFFSVCHYTPRLSAPHIILCSCTCTHTEESSYFRTYSTSSAGVIFPQTGLT